MEQRQESPRFILILGTLFLFAYAAFNLATAWMETVLVEEGAVGDVRTPTLVATTYLTATASPTSVSPDWITPTVDAAYPKPEPTDIPVATPTSTPTDSSAYPPPAEEASTTPTQKPTDTPLSDAPTATLTLTIVPSPTPTSEVTATPTNAPTATPTSDAYPGPGDTAYPGPEETNLPTNTPTATFTPDGEEPEGITPTPTSGGSATPTLSLTPASDLTATPPLTTTITMTPRPLQTSLPYSDTVIILNGSINQVAWSADGQTLALATSKGASVYDARTLEKLRTLDVGSEIAAVAFIPNDNLLITGGRDASLRVWDPSDGSFVLGLQGHLLGVVRLGYSQAHSLLVSGSDDATVRIWDGSGAILFVLRDPVTRVLDLAVSRSGGLVAAISNQHVHVWSLPNANLLKEISRPLGWYDALAFSPDDLTLVIAYKNRRLEFWNTNTWDRIDILRLNKRVRLLTFSPNGNLLVAVYEDDSIRIWDAGSKTLLADLSGYHQITGMVFNPAGDKLVTSSADGTIRIWDITPLR